MIVNKFGWKVSRYYRLLSLVFLSVLLACSGPKGKIHEDVLGPAAVGEILIDTLFISPVQSSQNGFFRVFGDNIYYVDQLYGFIEAFDPSGTSLGVKKRLLDGPDELQGISELLETSEGFLIRHEWFFYRYDRQWGFLGRSALNFPLTVSYDEMLDRPKGEFVGMYELQSYNAKTISLPDGHLATKIDVEHPIFNAFTTREFYTDSRILGLVNPQSGKVSQIIGTRPVSYGKYRFVPFHIFMDYHWTAKNEIFVTYEVDSMIYVYDSDWKLKNSFGRSGKNMLTDYEETQNLEVAFEGSKFIHSRNHEGYYKDIYVDEKGGLVFRTYRQGVRGVKLWNEFENPLRLQIYKNDQLLGDFEVPGRFRILTGESGRYWADGFYDEKTGRQGIYVMTLRM